MTNERSQEQDISNYLTMLKHLEKEGKGMASLVVKHGRFWTPREYSGVCPIRYSGQPKQCHANAQLLLQRLEKQYPGKFTYVEGYACSGSLSFAFPTHHSWLVDENGNVADPTWPVPETSTYFGIPFQTAYVFETMAETGFAGSLIDNMRTRWSLLSNPDEQSRAILQQDLDDEPHRGHAHSPISK